MHRFFAEFSQGDSTLKIVIVVGELSGDLLAANLVQELRKIHPTIEFNLAGIIGPNLAALGAKEIYNMKHLNVMGIVDPLLRLPKLLYIRFSLYQEILKIKPDCYIGVDAPEFNLSLEKKLKRLNIPTIHYVSPSVWAWRSNRVKLIKAAVDLMLTLFPFEVDFYRQHKVNAVCVGHPLADQIALSLNPASAKLKLGFKPDDKILTIMPGSRTSELHHLALIYIQTAKEILVKFPYFKFIIPVVSLEHLQYINRMIARVDLNLPIKIILQDSYNAIQAADLVLVTSGTATLEVMLHQKPMVVAYKTNFITYNIVKHLVTVKYIALPNILANKGLVKEFIQDQVTPVNLSDALAEIIQAGGNTVEQALTFQQLHQQLHQNASKRAAAEISKLLAW